MTICGSGVVSINQLVDPPDCLGLGAISLLGRLRLLHLSQRTCCVHNPELGYLLDELV